MASHAKLNSKELVKKQKERRDDGGRTEGATIADDENLAKNKKKSRQKRMTRRPTGEGLPLLTAEEEAKMFEPQLPLVTDFLERVLFRERPIKALVLEFRAVKRPITKEDFAKMTAFTANHPRNRYKDVGCTEHNRVVLHMGDQPYIHANYAGPQHEPKKFICTQAPTDTTIPDFWSMVVQEGTRCILMLCNYFEGFPKKVPKCAQYLPKADGPPQTYGLVTVRARCAEKFRFREKSNVVIVKTLLEVSWESRASDESNVATRKRAVVEHLHWQDWPDRGVPPADSGPIELIQYLQSFRGQPVIVHCSAGIGRTGCIVLMDMLLDRVARQMPWPADLFTLINEIRRQRHNSVQTEHQYLYCHVVMINFLQKEGILTQEMLAALPAWQEEYVKESQPHKG